MTQLSMGGTQVELADFVDANNGIMVKALTVDHVDQQLSLTKQLYGILFVRENCHDGYGIILLACDEW